MYWAVILAGGLGTRLWPMSREKCPKQALKLVGDRTMFQHSVDRLQPMFPLERVLVVTRAEYRDLLHEQVPKLPEENIVAEPAGRGTAPAIGLAAVHLKRRDPEAVMAVLTADHYIADTISFREVLGIAEKTARKGYLVTLGIQPSFPSTGYGYIEQGNRIDSGISVPIYEVNRFVEKPDLAAALQMMTDGRYTWNSGMFIWRVDRILQEIARHMPELSVSLGIIEDHIGGPDDSRVLREQWEKVQKETIDYGVMEKAGRIAVIPASIGWVDVGNWSSLFQLRDQDPHGNVWTGPHIAIDTQNTLAFTGGEKLIATIGVEELIIVDTQDALLICKKDCEQDVRLVVKQLERSGETSWL